MAPAMRWDELYGNVDAYAAQIRNIYADAEEIMLERVRKRLEKGIDKPGWAEKKLAEIRQLNKDIQTEIKDLSASDAGVNEAIVKAYDSGVKASIDDLVRADLLDPATANFTRGNALKALVKETTSALSSTHFRILRTAQDAYRESVAVGSSQILAGTQTLRGAVQNVLNRFADKGISGFVDKAGKHWTAPSYAEMAVRTAAQNAARQGHSDKLVSAGKDLVIISSHGASCDICAPWEGRVVSLSGNDSKYPSMADAQADGLMHPNCKHRSSLYTPGLTREETKVEYDPAAYQAQQEQRKLERGLRQWKRREAVALTDDAKAVTKGKVGEWRTALKDHISTVNEDYRKKYGKDPFGNDRQLLYRQSWREQVR